MVSDHFRTVYFLVGLRSYMKVRFVLLAVIFHLELCFKIFDNDTCAIVCFGMVCAHGTVSELIVTTTATFS